MPPISSRGVFIASALIFILCLSSRLAIIAALGVPPIPEQSEVNNIAVSLARGQGFANAFAADSGPTAHSAPVYPYLVSLLFRQWGTERTGTLAQMTFGYALSSLGYALLPGTATVLGMPALVGVTAGFAAALLPLNFYAERGTFEEPLTAVSMVFLVLLHTHLLRRGRIGFAMAAGIGLVSGVALLVSPTLLTVIVAFSVLLLLRQRTWQTAGSLAVTAVCALLVLVPWAIRNRSVLGGFVWLRSNFGLELSMSNMDGAKPALEDNISAGGVHLRRHPYANPAELVTYRRLGELRYYRARLDEGLAWISRNTSRFAVLTVARFVNFWFPTSRYKPVTWISNVVTVLAIAGIVLWTRQDPISSLPVVLPFVVFPAVYYVIEASRRYRYPLEALMMLMACYTVFRLAAAITGRASLSADARRDSEASSTRVRSATSA